VITKKKLKNCLKAKTKSEKQTSQKEERRLLSKEEGKKKISKLKGRKIK